MTASEVTASDQRAETWKPVAPMDGCTFSGYEASDKGRYRSVDRQVNGRQLRGKVLSTRLDDDGYVLITIRCDARAACPKGANGRHTFLGHKVVLTTFDRPCPEGMETCHSDRGPAFNWWPEGIRWGTKLENEAEKPVPSVPPAPKFPCRNAQDGCPGQVVNEGNRCRACVIKLGVDGADMLRAWTPLPEVAAAFRVSEDWAWRLAVEHGGYKGTRAQAQRPPQVIAEELNGGPVPLHELCRCPECERGRRGSWWQRVRLRGTRAGDAK